MQRHVNLHHDQIAAAEVSFDWQLTAQGKSLDDGRQTFQMAPAELKRLTIEFDVPDVDQPTPLRLLTTVSRDGEPLFEQGYDYTAYPPTKLTVPAGVRLGLFDRAGRTSAVLAAHGVKPLRFGTLEPFVAEQLAGLNCLLIGAEGLDLSRMKGFAATVLPWVREGGVVLCLRQRAGLSSWVPAKLTRDARRTTTIAWPRDTGHPVLAGVSAEMLRYWRGDHVVARGDFVKAPTLGWRPIIDAGGPGGLRWAPLVEMRLGKGTIVLCQMLLTEKLDTEPAAAILLQKLLAYAGQYRPAAPVGVRVVGEADGAFRRRLTALGLEAGDSTEARVIVVDAAAPGADAETLRPSLAAGATVVLHGLTPEHLARWEALLPPGTTLEHVKAIHAVRTAQDPVLAGISATDLWWSEYKPWERVESGDVAVAYAVKPPEGAEGVRELVAPGALLAIPSGKGRLLIDQLLWEDTPDQGTRVDRRGQYAALLLHNLRVGARNE